MYLYLSIHKDNFEIEREIYVEYSYSQGGDGRNEPYWRETMIDKIIAVRWQDKSYDWLHDLSPTIDRFGDIYGFDLWGYIIDRINEQI
jgi:hypothetical protein